MDKDIIALWEQNKDKVKEYIHTNRQEEYSEYKDLVRLLVGVVINANRDDYSKYDSKNILVINDGDYQGTQLFLIHLDTYQPGASDYLITYIYYGSCSVCDTLQSISNYDYGLPNEEQVNDYMTLCLHLIQNMKYIYKD